MPGTISFDPIKDTNKPEKHSHITVDADIAHILSGDTN